MCEQTFNKKSGVGSTRFKNRVSLVFAWVGIRGSSAVAVVHFWDTGVNKVTCALA